VIETWSQQKPAFESMRIFLRIDVPLGPRGWSITYYGAGEMFSVLAYRALDVDLKFPCEIIPRLLARHWRFHNFFAIYWIVGNRVGRDETWCASSSGNSVAAQALTLH